MRHLITRCYNLISVKSPGEDENIYVLLLKRDFRGYVCLEPTKSTDAESVASSLIRWFSAFGVLTDWLSDRGSHSRNELVKFPKIHSSIRTISCWRTVRGRAVQLKLFVAN